MGYKRVKSVLNKYEEKQFQEWMEDGNVIKFEDGYATQDAQYGNRLKDLDALRLYFYNEFIKGQYAVGGSVLLAPNGKPSNLTPEQYKLVRTKAFKDWFGDWEKDPKNSSKVIDKQTKEPLVVYHGTNAEFTIFDTDEESENRKGGRWDAEYPDGYIFMISDKKQAEYYGERIIPLFVNLKYPTIKKVERGESLILPFDDEGLAYEGDAIVTDGVDYVIGTQDEFAVKLADGSNTTFDGNNPDIRYAGGGSVDVIDIKQYNIDKRNYRFVEIAEKKYNKIELYRQADDGNYYGHLLYRRVPRYDAQFVSPMVNDLNQLYAFEPVSNQELFNAVKNKKKPFASLGYWLSYYTEEEIQKEIQSFIDECNKYDLEYAVEKISDEDARLDRIQFQVCQRGTFDELFDMDALFEDYFNNGFDEYVIESLIEFRYVELSYFLNNEWDDDYSLTGLILGIPPKYTMGLMNMGTTYGLGKKYSYSKQVLVIKNENSKTNNNGQLNTDNFYAVGGSIGDLIKFKNLDNEVLVGRINNVLGENRYSVSSGFGSFLVDKSNYVGEVEAPAPRKKFLGIFAEGGNVSSIEKKVAEVNRLIELGNANDISVVDSSSTWQSPMKYKPIKYSNGVLYVEYKELDLYKYNRTGVSNWEIKKEKVLKRNMEFDNPLNDIAKMYRKALKSENIEFKDGGEAGSNDVFDATKLDLDSSISSRVYYKGVDNEINRILQNNYKPVYDFDKKGIEWVYKNTRYEVKDEDLILELKEALAERNRNVVDKMRINNELPRIESKYGKDVNFAKKMHQEAKDFYQNKLRNEKSERVNDVLIDYLISRLKEDKKEFAKGGEAGFDDAGTSMVIYHEKKGNYMIPKGQIYLWLYDVEDTAKKLQSEEFDWVFYPNASMSMAWQKGFIPPLKKIWTKKFQKEHKGSEHLLGVIKAHLLKDGNELYIDMMSVNPNSKKKGIMSYMIKDLRDTFGLKQDQVTFSELTKEGEKFVAKGKYESGGDIPHKDKMFQLPLEMVVYVPSTQDVDNVISVDEMSKRVDEVKKYLSSKFGGYTSSDKLGGYVDSTGKLVNEEVTQVVSFSTQEAYQENKEELINKLSEWANKWGQEAIGFEFEGDLMYVPQKFKRGGSVKKKINFYYDKYENGGFIGGDVIKFNYNGTEYTRKVESVDENGNALVNLFKTEKAIINPADIKEIKKEFDDKSVIVNKIGLSEGNADFLLNLSPTFAVWLADAIVDANTKISKDGLTREESIKMLNNSPIIPTLRERIRGVLDWLQHPTTRKQNLRELSFAEAERKSKEWHDELQVQGGDINFTEPSDNIVLKEYPENDNGVKYYWVYIPQSYCDVESRRMGHCGRTGASSLISLRSIRPYTETDTITDSHVTIAFDINDGYIYQAKGKKNQKPAEKYYPYLFDIVKFLIQGKLSDKLRINYESETHYLNSQKRVLSKIISDLDKVFEDSEIDAILLKIYQNESAIKLAVDETSISDLLQKQNEVIDELNEQNEVLIEQYLEKLKKYSLDKKMVDESISSPRLLSKNYRKYEKELQEINNRLEEIEGIEISSFKGFSREYASSQDYGWQDMTKEEIKELYDIDSEVFNDFAGKYMLYEAGISDEKPNTEIFIEKDIKYLSELLNMNDIREDVFEDYFNDSVYEIYEPNFSYYLDNASDYVDELNKSDYQEVIDKIVEKTGLEKEVVEENGAKHYLAGDDDDFSSDDFEDINRAIAIALESAEASDYSDYFYNKLKSSLEELGRVDELTEQGLILKIDLLDKLSVGAIGSYMKDLDTDSLEDVFWEAVSQGDIELPDFSLDDRYSAYPSDWQELFEIDNY